MARPKHRALAASALEHAFDTQLSSYSEREMTEFALHDGVVLRVAFILAEKASVFICLQAARRWSVDLLVEP